MPLLKNEKDFEDWCYKQFINAHYDLLTDEEFKKFIDLVEANYKNSIIIKAFKRFRDKLNVKSHYEWLYEKHYNNN